jgi:hypothetical protein
MVRHGSGLFERPAVLEIGGDAGRAGLIVGAVNSKKENDDVFDELVAALEICLDCEGWTSPRSMTRGNSPAKDDKLLFLAASR